MTFLELIVGSPEHADALRLRECVLREPLGLTFTDAEIADEPNCFHLAAYDGDRMIAILLLRPVDETRLKMRQVAVCPSHQGRGVGAALIGFAEEFARTRGSKTMTAHARATALGFYAKLGYSIQGAPFIEATIPHQLVTKAL
jgi:GNAT superfamily N-acetyltransferase